MLNTLKHCGSFPCEWQYILLYFCAQQILFLRFFFFILAVTGIWTPMDGAIPWQSLLFSSLSAPPPDIIHYYYKFIQSNTKLLVLFFLLIVHLKLTVAANSQIQSIYYTNFLQRPPIYLVPFLQGTFIISKLRRGAVPVPFHAMD